MPEESSKCYAPVFQPTNVWACFWLTIIYTAIIAILVVLLIIALIGGPEAVRKIVCLIKQFAYRIANCKKGNSDPNIAL